MDQNQEISQTLGSSFARLESVFTQASDDVRSVPANPPQVSQNFRPSPLLFDANECQACVEPWTSVSWWSTYPPVLLRIVLTFSCYRCHFHPHLLKPRCWLMQEMRRGERLQQGATSRSNAPAKQRIAPRICFQEPFLVQR